MQNARDYGTLLRGTAVAPLGGLHHAALSYTMTDDPPPPNSTEPVTPPPGQAPGGPEGRLIYRSSDLMAGRREIFIEHNRDLYRLRLTSQGRLILTK